MSRDHAQAISAGDELFTARSLIISAPDGLPIAVRDHGGPGPAVLMIHGWSCNQDFWAPQIRPLSEHFRLVTLDLPGHGAAHAGAGDRAWSIAGYGADVVVVADSLGIDRLTLMGHSMGGAVAVEAALQLGDRCRLLMGVDTFNEAAFYGRRPMAEIRERCASFDGDFGATMRGMVRGITDESADPVMVEWIGDAMAATPRPVAVAVLEALLAWDIEHRWTALTVPAVAINSALLAARNELLELPDLELHHVAAAGHFPMLEQPDAFNALALAILSQRLA